MNYPISIRFTAPFRMGSGYGRAGLFDHTTIVDRPGRTYIPGSAIKGKLRHMCHRIISTLAVQPPDGLEPALDFSTLCPARGARRFGYCRGNSEDACAFCRLFGSPFHQGRYQFLDGELSGDWQSLVGSGKTPFLMQAVQMEPRVQVRIERSRGVTRTGHLFSTENGSPWLEFQAAIHGPDNREVETLIGYSLTALTHLGAGSAVGVGRGSFTYVPTPEGGDA